jgi:hypothetical protein
MRTVLPESIIAFGITVTVHLTPATFNQERQREHQSGHAIDK